MLLTCSLMLLSANAAGFATERTLFQSTIQHGWLHSGEHKCNAFGKCPMQDGRDCHAAYDEDYPQTKKFCYWKENSRKKDEECLFTHECVVGLKCDQGLSKGHCK